MVESVLIWIGAIIAAVIVFAIIANTVSAYEKRRGIGSWEKYGPDPTPQHINEVNRAIQNYFDGIDAALRGHRWEARQLWEQCVELDTRALVTLGVAEMWEGRDDAAKSFWSRAVAEGHEIAMLFIKLGKKTVDGLTRNDLARAFLITEANNPYSRNSDAQNMIIGLALHFGMESFARKRAGLRDADTRRDSTPYR